ncbi:MAG: LysR family transcriptional regulator [Polyangiales bacterium]
MEPLLGADLTALAALDALLTERHVTRAAARLGISQSSMSHHLAGLRARFGDPLLVRVGPSMALTPRAQAMAAPLAAAMDALRRAVTDAAPFDPARADRAFTLACPDLLAPLLPGLIQAIRADAPGVTPRVVLPGAALDDALATGRCDVALAPTPAQAPGLVALSLGRVGWCVIARAGHPIARRRALTREAWARYPHVVVEQGNGSPNRVGDAIARAGVRRTVGLTVPGFLWVPWVLSQTDMLFTAPRALVRDIVAALGLVERDAPVPLPVIPVSALWHERFQNDAGHRWFRERVASHLRARLAAHARPA